MPKIHWNLAKQIPLVGRCTAVTSHSRQEKCYSPTDAGVEHSADYVRKLTMF